jgi:hypothetical protein
MVSPSLPDRALRMVDGAPDVSGLPCDRLLDSGGAEYMRRFYMSHRGAGPQARFHQISASDPGRDFHDHPWDYITHLLSGSYLERTPDGDVLYEAPCTLVRKAEHLHRLDLPDGPVWTWFVTGQFRRRWGFMTEGGWVHYSDYTAAGLQHNDC